MELQIRFTKALLYDLASDSQNRKYMEIRRRFLELNPEVVRFDVQRRSDEITVVAGFREGPDRFDVRLIGRKHDFYRMAMGVRLGETAEALVRPDPAVESLGAGMEGDRVVLHLRYRPEAPAATAPPPGTPPPGVQAEVPAGTAPRDLTPPTVREAPAAAPVPGPAPAPEPEPEADRAWRQTLEDGSLQAFVRFLERYPEAPQAAEARRRADRLREEQAYRQALKRNEIRVYRAFLEHFPDSPHRSEVEARIRALEAELRRQETERRARQAEERRRRKAYEEARRLDTVEAYRIFLAAYPDAPEAGQVRRRIRAIEADDRAFREARGSEKALEAYLARHPQGRHAEEARAEIQRLRKARMEADYRAAVDAGTAEALAAFLQRWPGSPRESEVKAALERLRTPPEPPPPGGAAEPDTVLPVPEVEQAPTVDGTADDPVWARAPELRVPLQGAAGEVEVRVRGVWTEDRLFLLLRWEDPTRDALYRPWVWDPAEGTYRQNDQADDGLAVALYPAGVEDPCMLTGRDLEADLWIWRAFWSEISGLASDARLQISRVRMPRSNPYPARDGSGQVWIREELDTGASGWSFFIPVEFQGSVVPSYKPSRAAGSRADVRARGRWQEGRWTVELSRLLDTGHDDDRGVRPGERVPVALGVYDRGERGQHSTSNLFYLRLDRGR